MTETWTQERPAWCPHPTCLFKRRVQDAICCGDLPEPEPHDGDENTYRMCLNGAADDGGVFDLQVNATDLCPVSPRTSQQETREEAVATWNTRMAPTDSGV